MSALAVMGVGCRKGVQPEAILDAVSQTLALSPVAVELVALHTSVRKQGEVGLKAAAERLRLKLHFHEDAALRAEETEIETRSERVQALFGVGSVAEAAALAGGGGRLIVAKHNVGDVSCAIALFAEAAR